MAKDLGALEIINNYSPSQLEKVIQESDSIFLFKLFEIAYDFYKIYIFVSEEEINDSNPYFKIMEQISNKIIFHNLELEQKITIWNIVDKLNFTGFFEKCITLQIQIERFHSEFKQRCSDLKEAIETFKAPSIKIFKEIVLGLTVLLAKDNQQDFIDLSHEFASFIAILFMYEFYYPHEKELDLLWKNDDAMKNLLSFFSLRDEQPLKKLFWLTRKALVHDSRYLLNRIFSEYNNTKKSFLTINSNIDSLERIFLIAIESGNAYIVKLLVTAGRIKLDKRAFKNLKEYFIHTPIKNDAINEILKLSAYWHEKNLNYLFSFTVRGWQSHYLKNNIIILITNIANELILYPECLFKNFKFVKNAILDIDNTKLTIEKKYNFLLKIKEFSPAWFEPNKKSNIQEEDSFLSRMKNSVIDWIFIAKSLSNGYISKKFDFPVDICKVESSYIYTMLSFRLLKNWIIYEFKEKFINDLEVKEIKTNEFFKPCIKYNYYNSKQFQFYY